MNLLVENISRACSRFVESSSSSSSSPHIFPNLVAGPRGSGRSSLLQALHDNCSSFVKRQNHFHCGATPMSMTRTVHDVERRVQQVLQEDDAEEAEEDSSSSTHHILVVTVDDFDTIALLHALNNSDASNSSNNNNDGGGADDNSSGAGRFAGNSNNDENSVSKRKQRHESLRDFWGWFFDGGEQKKTSAQKKNIVVLLFAAVATTSSASTSAAAEFVPASSVLSGAAVSDLWIFPAAAVWELPAVSESSSPLSLFAATPAAASLFSQHGLLSQDVERFIAVSKFSKASSSAAAGDDKKQHHHFDIETRARRQGCHTAFLALKETIDRFAFHCGLQVSNTGLSGSTSSSSSRPGAVAAALQPPSGVLVYENQQQHHHSQGCSGRADFVADLAQEYCSSNTIAGLNTHSVEAPLLFGPIFGETEERIRAAFADAYSARPCVLFVHNVEAVAASRGSVSMSSSSSSSSSSGNVLQRAVATFLCEADGVDRPDRSSSVLLVATTSRRGDLDDAALRPGRLEQHILLSSEFARGGEVKNVDDALADSRESFFAAWGRDEVVAEERLSVGAALRLVHR